MLFMNRIDLKNISLHDSIKTSGASGKWKSDKGIQLKMSNALLLILVLGSFTLAVVTNERQSNEGGSRTMTHKRNYELLNPSTMSKSVGYSQLATVTHG